MRQKCREAKNDQEAKVWEANELYSPGSYQKKSTKIGQKFFAN